MSDQQSQLTSVAPSDSASKAGKKSKPGKQERAARRSAVDSVQGQQASAAKAFTFSSGMSAPKPQPGKYPVVFQTGAGEPARDKNFVLDERVINTTLSGFPNRFTFNAKYSEFKSHAEIEDSDFKKDLGIAALLRLAQQLVHSHVNMGLPQGDLAPVASTDVKLPSSLAAYLGQYGEHSVPALGTRFLLGDYENTVRAVIWAADQMRKDGKCDSLKRMWLPVRPGDYHTKMVIASRLAEFLASANISISSPVLEEAVLSGNVPDEWEIVKPALGPAGPDGRDRFDFLFKSYRDSASFVTGFTTDRASAVLAELDLSWANPKSSHVDWTFNAKEIFVTLSDAWARKSTTYAAFFEMSSSQSNRNAALGSQAQMATVSTNDSVTVVKTHLALAAPEFSLAACFPPGVIYSGGLSRRVVVTTPLSVTQRATEFVQMDWR